MLVHISTTLLAIFVGLILTARVNDAAPADGDLGVRERDGQLVLVDTHSQVAVGTILNYIDQVASLATSRAASTGHASKIEPFFDNALARACNRSCVDDMSAGDAIDAVLLDDATAAWTLRLQDCTGNITVAQIVAQLQAIAHRCGQLGLQTESPLERPVQQTQSCDDNDRSPSIALNQLHQLTLYDCNSNATLCELRSRLSALNEYLMTLPTVRFSHVTATFENLTTNDNLRAIAAADLDGDGYVDITVGSLWFRNVRNELFEPNRLLIEAQYGHLVRSVSVADMDGDELPDVVALVNDLIMFRNEGAGNFIEERFEVSDSLYRSNQALHLSDLDLDGKMDVVLSSDKGNQEFRLAWVRNTDDASGLSFDEQPLVTTECKLGLTVTVADLDNDLLPDIIPSCFWIKDGILAWYKNNMASDGLSAEPQFIATSNIEEDIILYPTGTRAADIDGDGSPDLVLCLHPFRSGRIVLRWYRNMNDGSEFELKAEADVPATVNSIDIADLDGDERLDLVTCISDGNFDGAIWWWRLDDSGNFIHYVVSDSCRGARQCVIADVNGDGQPDILAVCPNSNSPGDRIMWFQGGTF